MSLLVLAQGSAPVIPDFGGGGNNSCVRDNKLFCGDWLSDNWSDTLRPALTQHITLTLESVAIGFVVAFLLGVLAYRKGYFEQPISIVTGVLYTIPSIAAFQILVTITGLERWTAIIPLASYTLLIIFRNTLAGLRNVPDEVKDAAEGMGLTKRQALLKVELPLALPAIIAGLRIATVTVVSLATIASYVINEGLGVPLFAAVQRNVFKTEIISAGVLAILLAFVSDAILVVVQRVLTPWTRSFSR